MKMKRSIGVMVSFLFLLSGCSDDSAEPGVNSESEASAVDAITDTETEPVIRHIADMTDEMTLYDYGYDDMDRGNYEYYAQEVVIDPRYYEGKEIARGDVIAFKPTPDERLTVKRVIGLPGEKVKVEKGQVYIDGKELDTFYGRYHRRGLDLKELKNMLATEEYGFMQSKANIESNVHNAENMNLEEVTVPENQVYVIGDDWFRTYFRGMVPMEKIEGQVLGYEP